MTDVGAYKAELDHSVAVAAEALGQFVEDAFFDAMTAQMVEAGELDMAERVHLARRGMQADGHGGNPSESGDALTLLLLDHSPDPQVESLTATDLEAIFKRGVGFLEAALEGKLLNTVEETSPAFDLVDLVRTYWRTLAKVRLCVISNRQLSKRVDGMRVGECRGIPLVHSVWDLERSAKYAHSRSEREDVEVNLEEDFDGAIPVLPAHLEDADYEAYLAVIPGPQLASIYDRWGARLLEQNVRVFLQARGGVNKGIKRTIEQAPEMFFAYNNGISATAESVTFKPGSNGRAISSIRNLQIVNGGQTTASIHAAAVRKDRGLARVFVQMKLSIIPQERTAEIVPKISEYANSQNKISAADFFSNHPFHVRMEEFSRRLIAPVVEGSFVGSRWFYERARGQYNDERARRTGAARTRFDQEYPKSQLVTKTDLAKHANAWDQQPDLVSKGAQKNFAAFAVTVSEAWDKKSDVFNERYFQHAMAKAIGFNHLERLVTRQPWYQNGYRAQIVAYACAKLSHEADRRGMAIDFDQIWREQAVGGSLDQAMIVAAKAAHDVLTDPPSDSSNVTEWAKKQAAWDRLQDKALNWPASWLQSMPTAAEAAASTVAAVKEQKVLNGIHAQSAVVEAGGPFWRRVRAWGNSRKLLSIKEDNILGVAERIPKQLPTEGQCEVILPALARLQAEGFDELLPTAK